MRFIQMVLLCMFIVACKQPRQTNANQSQPGNENQLATSTPPEKALNLQQTLEDPPQLFTIPAGTTTITAKHGLKLEVKTADFEAEDGSAITGPVELTVKELVTPQQMIASDCPTVSDGRLLETAGSYFIGASGNGNKLRLKQGKKMRVEFPKRGDNMELFYGQRMADGSMNWQPVQKKLTGTFTAREEWEKRNKVTADPVSFNAPAKKYDAYTSAGSGKFLTTEAWFKAYHDTIMQHRRNIIRKNFRNMTQPQIRKVMEAPFKMSVKDFAKFRDMSIHRYRNAQDLAYYTFDGFDLYVTAKEGTDSVVYIRDTIAYQLRQREAARADSIWRASGAYYGYNNLETAVDSSGKVRSRKNGKLVTVPGKAKVTVSYYEPVELEQLGWINCDRFYNYPDGITPEYTIDIKGAVPSEIGVYVICKNINGVMSNKISTNGQSKKVIRQQLPLNSEVEFLVYSKIDKQFLQSKYTARITNGMVIPVDLKPVPDGQVKKVFLN